MLTLAHTEVAVRTLRDVTVQHAGDPPGLSGRRLPLTPTLDH
jgi:hypothetical protein